MGAGTDSSKLSANVERPSNNIHRHSARNRRIHEAGVLRR